MTTASEAYAARRRASQPWNWSRATAKILIYAALLTWAFICLFPIYWTISTSF